MRVLILDPSASVADAVAARRRLDAAAVVVAGDSPDTGTLAGALADAGVRVATYAGATSERALAEMVAELFGPDAEVVNLRQ